MTHLADADGKDSRVTERQLDDISRRAGTRSGNVGSPSRCVHTANSAAIVRFPNAHFSLVRPGIMLYGYHTLAGHSPRARSQTCPLTPHHGRPTDEPFHKGEPSATTAHSLRQRPTRIAVLPIGYADGYSRRLSHRGSVLIQGAAPRSSVWSAWI